MIDVFLRHSFRQRNRPHRPAAWSQRGLESRSSRSSTSWPRDEYEAWMTKYAGYIKSSKTAPGVQRDPAAREIEQRRAAERAAQVSAFRTRPGGKSTNWAGSSRGRCLGCSLFKIDNPFELSP